MKLKAMTTLPGPRRKRSLKKEPEGKEPKEVDYLGKRDRPEPKHRVPSGFPEGFMSAGHRPFPLAFVKNQHSFWKGFSVFLETTEIEETKVEWKMDAFLSMMP